MTMSPTPENLTDRATGSAQHYPIVVIGGGAGGITVAAQLKRKAPYLNVAIVEPSATHYYQPAWTLVGGGVFSIAATAKPMADCIPPGVQWIQAAVTQIEPDQNYLITGQGQRIDYDYLIVAAGIQINWHLIEGLPEAISQGGVCSNYAHSHAPYTWEAIQAFKGGNALFTFPGTPIKCGGAPQKIMYLADDAFRRQGVRDRSSVHYCSATPSIFPVKAYAEPLQKVVARRGIETHFRHDLKAIRAASKEAVFTVTNDAGEKSEVVMPYDFIHVTPPMGAPDFIKSSSLAAPDTGWVNVHKETLQHVVYANVFSLGDVSSLPNSKTAAAIRGQAPVLVTNLLAAIAKQPLVSQYNGYACCPLITGYDKVIMAEFDYNNQPLSTFPFDPRQERYSMWVMKRYILPWVYWNRMLKGLPHERELSPFPGWQLPQ